MYTVFPFGLLCCLPLVHSLMTLLSGLRPWPFLISLEIASSVLVCSLSLKGMIDLDPGWVGMIAFNPGNRGGGGEGDLM